jgi:conjugal transfer pilus assembly protein TraF
MKNVLSRVLSIVLLSLAVAPLSGGALAQGSGALGVRDDSNPAYWSDRWRGWHFYEDPPQEEVEPPSRPAPSTAPRPTASPRPPELVEFERLQKTLEDLRNIAIMRPSEANVRRYMELEMQVVNRASYFADVAQRVAWATPDLDPSLQGRPVNAQALEVFERQQRTDRSASVANLGRDHVLFFFYRSDCPYCHAFGPTLQAFEARHGIQVVAVSVDGGPLPGFPRARARQRHRHRTAGHPGARRLPRPALLRKDHADRLWRAVGVAVAGADFHRLVAPGRSHVAQRHAASGTAIGDRHVQPIPRPPPVHPPTPGHCIGRLPGDAEHRPSQPCRPQQRGQRHVQQPGSHRELHRPRGHFGGRPTTPTRAGT